ncbi:hypothetical protein M3P36_09850 [Altererythrobacter sp. KTW20L]|uniref:hypothetical protein n=1 Tax=Altererythrobacter sp. KTW20L TaxID=2942210 RepID=UPI0020C168CD|nr:hypothetical protein [Altererythrobacter sp. KTW20L]MCL6251341.1 hypothetical protein [Altererythrobacter sp. KTW20L]
MIRTKTTLVIGPGAGLEIELPDKRELLGKIAAGFDFARLGSELQTRDMVMLARHFDKFARQMGATRDKLMEAGQKIRVSAKVGTAIDAVLEQHNTDPLVMAAGKLAIVYLTLQAEARSPLMVEPRDAGDLPLRGQENWLFQLGRLITSGVPRNQADKAFENLSIINFGYDRSIQHYLPFVVSMAFGMTLGEARAMVGARLNVIHPFGRVGRLPWEPGEGPDVEWGNEEPWNLHNLVKEIVTASERLRNRQYVTAMHGAIAGSKKIVFLGFDFDPQTIDFLFDYSLSHDPDILAAVQGMNEPTQLAATRMLKRRAGIEDDDLVSVLDMRCYQLMRDYSLFLES